MNHSTDFLVIGSGIAGLSFALEVAAHGSVILVTKKEKAESSTSYAQGGIASVMGAKDSSESHIQDTLTAGGGLCDEEVVRLVIREGTEAVKKLIERGVQFSKKNGAYDLGREGGHSHRRVLHAKDATGAEIERALLKKVLEHPNISLLENHFAIDLITNRKINPKDPSPLSCLGAYVLDEKIQTLRAKVTLLATGGAGKVYLYTSNPDIATGDGMAMAARAGAQMNHMEFVQFHPTCLYNPAYALTKAPLPSQGKSFLISEAVRGEGGILRLASGKTFMEKYHPLKELAPRDVVARAIDTELKKSGEESVFLDVTHKSLPFLKERFPNIYQKCLEIGLDISQQPIPVVPAAHYFCGGVVTNREGQTNIQNLYAVGEVACTGLHGANRLASNSLLEAVVFADRAAKTAIKEIPTLAKGDEGRFKSLPDWDPGTATDSDEQVVITQNWDEIRR
ncbi:MAG: L-aspartate oxidase, partial [bacterium]|nr:L-aspartate oxidase [bacterium]